MALNGVIAAMKKRNKRRKREEEQEKLVRKLEAEKIKNR